MYLQRVFFGLFCGFFLNSCQYFNTQRISSETFYEEEMERIDWSDVDTYPAFKECETKTEKEEQKLCFQNVVVVAIQKKLSEENLVVSQTLQDTVNIILQIENTGVIQIQEMSIDSLVAQKIPALETLIRESIFELPKPSPSYKRGIPVTSRIQLPFILNSENL
ncbi:MAG: hypothetical protein R2781_06305 [Flavobacteriaceae bacterium]